jgi:penicillin-binding protein 1A
MFKKFLLFLLFIFIIGGVGIFLYLYNSTKVDIDKLVYYNPPLTTQFFDRNGKLVADIFDKEHRLYVKFKDIPPRVIETLVATEDTTFFINHGFNIEAIFRALIKDLKAGKKVEGASTLTQQLVKIMYLNRKKSLKRKIKELFIAMKIDKMISKTKILEIYLNQIYLGHGYYGIKTASEGYFHKSLKDLTLKEIAMLIALPKAPSYYSPTKHYEKNIIRANTILRRMLTLGWITKDEYKKAIFERPKVYNTTLTRNKAPYIIDMALKELKKKYPDIKTGGYKVKLSIDLDIQKLTKESVKWGYSRLRKRFDENDSTLNGAMITINSKTGDILGAVGGVDYKKSNFNRVIQSKRSIGSAIKPFVYQIALNLGYNPESKIPDVSRTYKISDDINDTNNTHKYWHPSNYEKNSLGYITLRKALVHSRNLATVNLASLIGIENVIKGLYFFGFDDIPSKDMSVVLGSSGMSLLKLAEEYTLFSNYGVKVKPRLILEILNPKKGLDVKYLTKKDDILDEDQAYLMIDILKDVVKKGTGIRARLKGIEVAGKTGTTNNFRDAWWCGFTPSTTTIIWYGNDNYKTLGKNMTGGKVSAPVFKYFYTKLLRIHPELSRYFKIPKGIKYFSYKGKKYPYTKISKPPKLTQYQYVPVF